MLTMILRLNNGDIECIKFNQVFIKKYGSLHMQSHPFSVLIEI